MEFEGRSRIEGDLDMAPLIDVVLLLLIFFMLTSTFLVPEAIKLELPTASSAQAAEKTPIVVLLGRDGEIVVNGTEVSLAALQDEIRSLLRSDTDQTVTLKADAQVAVQEMLEVMDEIRAAGGRSIALSTRPKP
jgi:biopolymer transport protein ExbD